VFDFQKDIISCLKLVTEVTVIAFLTGKKLALQKGSNYITLWIYTMNIRDCLRHSMHTELRGYSMDLAIGLQCS